MNGACKQSICQFFPCQVYLEKQVIKISLPKVCNTVVIWLLQGMVLIELLGVTMVTTVQEAIA